MRAYASVSDCVCLLCVCRHMCKTASCVNWTPVWHAELVYICRELPQVSPVIAQTADRCDPTSQSDRSVPRPSPSPNEFIAKCPVLSSCGPPDIQTNIGCYRYRFKRNSEHLKCACAIRKLLFGWITLLSVLALCARS